MERARVLVVDDDERNRRLLDGLLTAAGYDTLLSPSGADSLLQVEARKPDLLLLDVTMPGMSGLQVCRILKEKASTREIPIVMVTGLADRKDHEQAIEAGADDFVTKPVDKGVLLLRIKSLLRLKRYADENRSLQELKKDLIGMIVHDLSNPLGVVSVALSFVLQNLDLRDDDFVQSLRDAEHACSEAQSLVLNMLDHARFERSAVHPHPEGIDLLALVNEVVRLQPNYRAAKIAVSAGKGIAPVFADINLTRRILTNLLENALRHSPDGCDVALSLELRDPFMMVSVQDRGPGIPFELHRDLFEKFRQGGDCHERVDRLGLGLAFCKLAAEAQGGSIAVESSGREDGARFSFTLPIAGQQSL